MVRRRDSSGHLYTQIVLAIGMISLEYGRLETTFRELFRFGTGLDAAQSRALFHRIQNDVRLAFLEDRLASGALPDEAVQLIEHFATAYRVCVENRNSLMHSFAPRGAESDQISLAKYTRSGATITFPAPLVELVEFVEALERFTAFGELLFEDLLEWQETGQFQPLSWPGTLPLPRRMDWSDP